ncbi:MAG: polysaccharide ABC transporter ATP-binding protein [Fuerstiella sp.]
MNDHSPPKTPAIAVNTVSKKFCRSLKRSLMYGVQDTIHDLTGRSLANIGLRKDEFWANDDVSFDIHQGECVGLIGHNGAGKTTVLKMLNGLIKPDGGSITLRGRVGALIALGAGFNPVLTGRENIFINGAVLGLSRSEVASQLNEIIDFAEIGDYIDTPVRSYSSGMQVRLGFAVATAMKPDILLIDEVLAVGDLDFRMKCITRITKLVDSDTAVVLVSHSMTDIQRVCTRTIVMDHGKVEFDGDVSEGIAHYEAVGNRRAKAPPTGQPNKSSRSISFLSASATVNGRKDEETDRLVVNTGDNIRISFQIECHQAVPHARLRLYIDSENLLVKHIASLSTADQLTTLRLTPGIHKLSIEVPNLPLRVGAYSFGVSAHTGERNILIPNTHVGTIHVVGPTIQLAAKGDAGLFAMETKWTREEMR